MQAATAGPFLNALYLAGYQANPDPEPLTT